MPALVCSAKNCMYNNAMYCTKGDIEVTGEAANVCEDTSCSSFTDRTCDSAKNSVGTCASASMNTDIDCDAGSCAYNKDRRCSADHVDISGASAYRSDQTECVTFTEKQ